MENMADKIRCRIENFRRTKRCLNVKNRVQFREISAIKLGAELKNKRCRIERKYGADSSNLCQDKKDEVLEEKGAEL